MTRDEVITQAGLQVMAETAIHAWVARDFWTSARAEVELADAGVSLDAVVMACCLAAAALLVDACDGSSARAVEVAAERLATDVGRHARLLASRVA